MYIKSFILKKYNFIFLGYYSNEDKMSWIFIYPNMNIQEKCWFNNLFVRIVNHFRKNILWHNLVNYKRVMWLLHDTWYESYTRLKLSHVYVCMYVCDNKCSEGINKFIEQLCHLHFIIINFEYIISSAVMNF